ncbi:MAG: phosphatidylserine/phosphatidylglycerophosphate/cardiolipin synthase family protein [Candidatus Eremiobacteraeota bacterium]|nr:phosphatidylserine/phosphatidylglycerophosphate/cardiolipin synthase family protein [Candidatus Eremiobacteraeota bacterium]
MKINHLKQNIPLSGALKSAKPPETLSVDVIESELKLNIEDETTLNCPEAVVTSGNKIKSIIGGAKIFKATEKMIDSAKENIKVEMYDFQDMKMAQKLIAAVKRGVDVKVIVDPTSGSSKRGSRLRREMRELMRENGVNVVEFPVDKGRNQIDHVKLMIVDGKKAMLGGMNWNTYSKKNHDADIQIEGPAVNYYSEYFAEGWNLSSGEEIKPGKFDDEAANSGKKAVVMGLRTKLREDKTMQKAILESIKGAKKSVHAELYVLSNKKVIKELKKAHKRGVDVRVILDPNFAYTGWSPNGKSFDILKKAGVPVRWFKVEKGQKLHAKWATVDGEKFLIGSANWSHKGLNINREIGAHVEDEKVTNEFEQQFFYDWRYKATEDYPL